MDWFVIFSGIVLGLASLQSAVGDEPGFKIKCQSPDDRIEYKLEEDCVAFEVRSRKGIGRASIERLGNSWPRCIVLRLRLKGLESFAITASPIKLNVSVSSQDGSVRMWKGDEEDDLLDEQSPYWIRSRLLDGQGNEAKRLPLNESYIELRLPQKLWEANQQALEPQSLELRWIDFYRS